MSIKEIADAYDVKYELIGTADSDFVPLVVFNKKNACKIIEKLRFECVPITGCVVWRITGEEVKALMPIFEATRFHQESCPAFLQRSCDEAFAFVKNYPQYTNDMYCEF